jgi:hypothetical protein
MMGVDMQQCKLSVSLSLFPMRRQTFSTAVLKNGRCNVNDHPCRLERMLPVELSGQRIKSGNAVAGPADQYSPAGLLDDNGRRIRSPIVQGPPFFRSGDFIKRDQACVLAADVQYEQTILHQRGGGDPPDGNLDVVFGLEVFFPEDVSFCRIETEKMPHRSERIGPAVIEGDRRTRAIGIADLLVLTSVGMRPDLFELPYDTLFPPDAVPAGSSPLGPVRGQNLSVQQNPDYNCEY